MTMAPEHCGRHAMIVGQAAPSIAQRRRGLARTDRLPKIVADLAVIATFAAVATLFMISPITLEAYGIQYIDANGGALAKFHPATFMACGAFALRLLAHPRPSRLGWRLLTNDAGVVFLIVAVVAAIAFSVFGSKTPVTPLVDTFLLPIVFFLLLRDLDESLIKWLAFLLIGILCANAAIALIEFLRGFHLVHIEAMPGTSNDPTRGDTVFDWRSALSEDWRATALFGHPLSNGVITGCAILCFLAPGSRWLATHVRVAMAALLMASMFAFGARTALVLSIVFGGFQCLRQITEAIDRGSRLRPRDIAVGLLVVGILIGAVTIVVHLGFFDRTLDRFVRDEGSASTRVTMFSLFDPLTVTAIVLGPDKDLVATLQRMYGLEFGIESSWIGLVLTYGLIETALVMLALIAFSVSVVKSCGRGATLTLMFYLILVSVTASLSGKTITLAMAVVLALVFLRKDERRRPLWSTALVSLV